METAKVYISTVENLFFSWPEAGAVQIYWLHPRMLTGSTTEDQIRYTHVMKNRVHKKTGKKGIYIYAHTKIQSIFLSPLTINTLAENIFSCSFWISLTFSNI